MDLQYGRYRIVKELGKGTMGVVYQAHDPQIDRLVALKVMRPDRVTSEAFVARFLKEARAIGRLSHPHIVTIYDAGEDHDTIYIAMEFLEGEPFNDVLRTGRPDVAQCVEWARQIAATLDYAHRQGIVHRDIKPSNIIMTPDQQVKLTDFGIARIEEAAAGQQTQAGEILGTPLYMSPEQVMGQAVDGRSDLFSLGVILYEMVVGRRPFAGDSIAAIFRTITQDTPESPDQVDPFIPKALSDLIMKSLAKAPEQRFQTGAQMAAALAAVLPAAKPLAAHTDPAPGPPKAKLAVAAALLLALILGSAGYWLLRPGPGDSDRNAAAGPAAAVSPSRRPTPVDATQQSGTLPVLKVTSEPSGAHVYVDDGLKGRTPLDVPLPIGKYELRLNLEGHIEWQAQVNLDTDGETPVNVTLWPLE
ncbi:MAG: serine/threonine protein kinase [Desulfatitalea sp.]|nr:serine/threonine protein kinase [Desulfatitalea sp.]